MDCGLLTVDQPSLDHDLSEYRTKFSLIDYDHRIVWLISDSEVGSLL